ncbi:MAG: hypothetical protein EXQ85_09585 [Alphaproteobacteria bacterium]|nr:hypothetical protein [Alphaproteobacteria bacterium]
MDLGPAGARFRQECGVPVLVAGRIRTAEEAETLVASGMADGIAMARTWVAEPEWINKIDAGQDGRIRPCMSCNQACTGFLNRGYRSGCVIHSGAGREIEFPRCRKVVGQPPLVVVGGGPAGLEAARLAALRGFRVTL